MSKKWFLIALLGCISLTFSGCTWTVNLIVANNLDKDIKVKYLQRSDKGSRQFYLNPKTYAYEKNLTRINREKGPPELTTTFILNNETNQVEITIKPGQATHIGYYHTYQSREEILLQSELVIETETDFVITTQQAVELFEPWKNRMIEVLEIQ